MEDDNKALLVMTSGLVKKDFELSVVEDNFITEEALEKALAERIFEMIEHDLEHLFSILYRLDVNERKVHAALQPNNYIPGNIAVARLIIARQKEKAATRLKYKQDAQDEEVEEW
jgi:hypothetical protein